MPPSMARSQILPAISILPAPTTTAKFALTWTERGGPRIDHQSDGEGFGSLLAHATVKSQFAGEISRDWNPEGLTIRLSFPRDRVIAE